MAPTRLPAFTTLNSTSECSVTDCVKFARRLFNSFNLWLIHNDALGLIVHILPVLHMYGQNLEPKTGFEPATRCLQNSRSTTELLRHTIYVVNICNWVSTYKTAALASKPAHRSSEQQTSLCWTFSCKMPLAFLTLSYFGTKSTLTSYASASPILTDYSTLHNDFSWTKHSICFSWWDN